MSNVGHRQLWPTYIRCSGVTRATVVPGRNGLHGAQNNLTEKYFTTNNHKEEFYKNAETASSVRLNFVNRFHKL